MLCSRIQARRPVYCSVLEQVDTEFTRNPRQCYINKADVLNDDNTAADAAKSTAARK